jgi:hypothetical protein
MGPNKYLFLFSGAFLLYAQTHTMCISWLFIVASENTSRLLVFILVLKKEVEHY